MDENLTGQTCPDCEVHLKLEDDSDLSHIIFECPNCEERFRGHWENNAYILESRI